MNEPTSGDTRSQRAFDVAAVQEGATVYEGNESIGRVSGILLRGGVPCAFAVAPGGAGEEVLVPVTIVDPERSTPEELWLHAAPADATTERDEAETLVVPLAEERLTANIREVERGVFRIHRRVETQPYHDVVHVRRDHVRIEHREVNQPVEETKAPWHEGETLVVPVYEEIPVLIKRLVLREEVRFTKESGIEPVQVDETIRRVVVEHEHIDNP